mmetsp:Transcript_115371/g.333281  ORF Transcript_115371/g.333281 Transcript_115371/m.333281 type:complete len:206 (-) Transcript_115371:415-1032(-)
MRSGCPRRVGAKATLTERALTIEGTLVRLHGQDRMHLRRLLQLGMLTRRHVYDLDAAALGDGVEAIRSANEVVHREDASFLNRQRGQVLVHAVHDGLDKPLADRVPALGLECQVPEGQATALLHARIIEMVPHGRPDGLQAVAATDLQPILRMQRQVPNCSARRLLDVSLVRMLAHRLQHGVGAPDSCGLRCHFILLRARVAETS